MTRHETLARLLALYDAPSYLEIGVNRGETFRELQAARKVGVDPNFLFDTTAEAVPGRITFHPMPSDAYFAGPHGGDRFDVVFLDGLHTFEQTLRDLLNAVAVLNEGGVIVLDDVLPNSYDASLPDFAHVQALRVSAEALGTGWSADGSWMGDVFKLVFFIESFLQRFSFATVAEGHGQTILWEQVRPAEALPPRTMEEISRLDYRDTIIRREVFRRMPLDAIVTALRQQWAGRRGEG